MSSTEKDKMKAGIKKMDKTIQKFISFVEEINKKPNKGGSAQEKEGIEK